MTTRFKLIMFKIVVFVFVVYTETCSSGRFFVRDFTFRNIIDVERYLDER